jgi:cytochrome c553
LVMAMVLLTLGGVIGFLTAASGVVPVTASSGHFAVTEWFLQFAKKRSVATHTAGVAPPASDAAWLVEKGAGHFETGCRPCHGAPDLPHPPRITRAMLPPPPSLAARAKEWQPEELFYIIKHGIKLTGMPAWPSPVRDDEIAAVVAFVREMPRLDAKTYRALAHGTGAPNPEADPLDDLTGTETPPRVAASCGRCHGQRGEGRRDSEAFPKLAGQPRDYLTATLEAYARDARASGMMQPVAAGLTPEEIRELAAFYSRLPARRRSTDESPAARDAIERGRLIAERGVPERDVPSCSDCHGPGGEPSSNYPALSGQFADYMVLQLELFAGGTRGGTEHAHLMAEVAPHMSEGEMRDVAVYYSSLK